MFNEREDLHRWNQKRYEALGEVTENAGQQCSANLVSSSGFIGLICPEQFLQSNKDVAKGSCSLECTHSCLAPSPSPSPITLLACS